MGGERSSALARRGGGKFSRARARRAAFWSASVVNNNNSHTHAHNNNAHDPPKVNVAEFKERPGAKDYIAATLLVERSSQKGIVIGAGGAALTKLSAASRRSIEEFLGRPVYLELRVEVAPDWRQQPERLQEYGYYDPLLM